MCPVLKATLAVRAAPGPVVRPGGNRNSLSSYSGNLNTTGMIQIQHCQYINIRFKVLNNNNKQGGSSPGNAQERDLFPTCRIRCGIHGIIITRRLVRKMCSVRPYVKNPRTYPPARSHLEIIAMSFSFPHGKIAVSAVIVVAPARGPTD